MRCTKAYLLGTDPPVAFVAHPLERGRWLKTEPCVVFVPCPRCKSPTGFPCMGKQGYMAGCHTLRRDEYMARKKRLDLESVRVPAAVLRPMEAQAITRVFEEVAG